MEPARSPAYAPRGSPVKLRRSKQTSEPRPRRPRRPRRVPVHDTWARHIINQWWERLYALAFGKAELGEQAQLYDANQGTRDYIWNTLGLMLWGALFPALTIVSTQLVGAEEAGHFNIAFTVATLLLFLGNYGVRTFQVSDQDEMDSFAAYLIQRVATCLIMIVCGWVYCAARGYEDSMALIAVGAFGYRALDAFADVFEGRLQQMDKLYLAGISCAARAGIPLAVFSGLLAITSSLSTASIGLAVSELVCLLLLTLPLTLLETPPSRDWQALEIREIFVECFPAFAAMFLFNLIESMPKFAMEGALPYEDQVYFSALYFPAQAVLMAVGFIYKPQLVRLASIWADSTKRAHFDLIVAAMLGVCALVTLVFLIVMGAVGIPLSSLMYATDFERFRTAQYVMIAAGGLAAGSDFLFQMLTVLREQASATRIYVLAFAFVAITSMVMVRAFGFMGAIWAYLAVMVMLFGLLAARYLLVRTQTR